MNKKESFAKFGVEQVNERWSWSGLSKDGQTLVLTLWSDQYSFDKESKIFRWSNFGCENELWIADAGNTHRIRDISFALEHLDGRFRAIRVEPEMHLLPERVIRKVSPITHLEWQITDFDSNTGECAGESFPEKRPF
jgi:hypothetical protein